MGKDKTDTILLDCPNINNDKNKFIEDKENSIKSNKSKGPPKFSLRVRTDLTAEVLEDENTNDSICSTKSKSNKSSSSSSSEPTKNSSSTSNKEKPNPSDVKSPEKVSSENKEEENTTQFRIASNNPTGFKLRIVPLEKLLEKPPPPTKPATPPAKVIKKEYIPAERSRRLPQRRSKPVSFIELSDTEEEDEEESESGSSKSDKKVNTKRGVPAKNSKKETAKKSESEEDQPKRTSSRRKLAKSSSDSEGKEPKKSNAAKKSTKNTSDFEENKAINSKSKNKIAEEISSDSEEDEPKKTKPNNRRLKASTDSKEKESNISKYKKKSAKETSSESEKDESKTVSSDTEIDKPKNTKSKTKIGKEVSVAEEKELKKSKTNKKSAKETSSESEKQRSAELSSGSEEGEPKTTRSRRNIRGAVEKELQKSKTNKKTAKETSSDSEKGEPEIAPSASEEDNPEIVPSGSEEVELKSTKSKKFKTNKKTAKEPSSDSEKDEPKKVSSGSEEEDHHSKKDYVEESEENESKKSKSSKKSAVETFDTDKKETKKSINNRKSAKEVSESEEDEPIQSKLILKVTSESEEIDLKNSEAKKKSRRELSRIKEDKQPSKSAKDSSVSESSDSEKNKSKASSSKRKRFEKSSESDEKESIRRKARKVSNRKSLQGPKSRTLTKDSRDISTDLETDAEEPVKQKSKSKSTTVQGPPPSPSSIRRLVVRVKRSKLSDFKDNCKYKSKRKMNGGGKSEKPSTSRRKQSSSEDDSDYDFRRAAIAEHDYDGRDVDDDDDDDDDDKASQKSTDSEIIPTRKKRVFHKEKGNSNNSDSDVEPKQKEKKKKRRVQNNSTDDSDDDDKKKSNRKDIRKIIKSDDLNLTTKEAAKQEQERRKRIEERQKLYNQIYEKPDSIEVTELVLDFDTEDATTLLEVDKGLMKKLKPHQVTGVKFMWDACFETLKDAQEKSGSGCILAHCMGLGKTMQIVTLSHTLLSNYRKTNVERVLIISPLSTLNNWAREFKYWISFTKKRNIEVYDMSKYKDKLTRIFKLNEWFSEGGVCIMGYDMYRILANEKAKGLKKKQRESLQQSLVDPGPDLVVCDEGHLLKNEKTSISKAVTRMRTQRRIVLTGTPLQNNLKEYYCMIQFIKPSLLGTYKEYLNRFVNPISNGQYTDSTDRDIRLMKHRSHILHKLLEGCIQRRDYSVLAPYLPPKHEYVVYTTLSILQQLLYEHYMVNQRDASGNSSEGKGAKLFQDFQELRRIWTHPMNMRINSDSVIRKKVLANESDSMDDFIDDDKDDDDAGDSASDSSDGGSSKSFGSHAAPSKVLKTRNFRRKAAEEGVDIDSDIEEVVQPQQDDPSEWWKRFVADKELNNINHSPKLVILMRLLEQCEAIGDKLLVFSQSLQSLDTIEHFLSLIDSKTRGYEYEGDVGDLKGFWKPGSDYFRLDGSCSVEQRESMCKQFNDASNLRARLFLISTRAGGLGINLVSANRVVIFDVSWNPSHDTQSIFRVYRFGQVKPCYIYRLIAMGTMEQKLYERQVAKQATAKRVIDEQQISRHYNQSDLQELYTYELKPIVPREIPILPKDRLFAELLTEHECLLFKYHEHDSLLENEESENLSAEERTAAWSEYEAEKTRAVQTAQYVSYDRSAYGQYGTGTGAVTSNKIFGFRSDVLLQLLNMKIAKDHPEMNQNQVIQAVPAYLNQLYTQMNGGDPSMYKDLLSLHATLTHPSGMYMNPLLYVNQNPQAAGYFQAGGLPANGVGVAPMPVMVPGGVPMMGVPMAGPAPVAAAAPGFDPNEVYEID